MSFSCSVLTVSTYEGKKVFDVTNVFLHKIYICKYTSLSFLQETFERFRQTYYGILSDSEKTMNDFFNSLS